MRNERSLLIITGFIVDGRMVAIGDLCNREDSSYSGGRIIGRLKENHEIGDPEHRQPFREARPCRGGANEEVRGQETSFRAERFSL